MKSLVKKIRNWSFGIGATSLIFTGVISPHFDREEYSVTILDKKISTERKGDRILKKYLVFTKLNSGEVRVFENTDSLFELKLDSEEIQEGLEVGKTYEIKTYGWRDSTISAYENIINYQEKKDFILPKN